MVPRLFSPAVLLLVNRELVSLKSTKPKNYETPLLHCTGLQPIREAHPLGQYLSRETNNQFMFMLPTILRKISL